MTHHITGFGHKIQFANETTGPAKQESFKSGQM